jgi:hypothetical protein
MKTYRPFIIGAGVGICISILANLMWQNYSGTGHFWAMLPVILAEPIHLILPVAPRAFVGVIAAIVLGLEYALLWWFLSIIVRCVRKVRLPFFVISIIACILVGGYAVTWQLGAPAVREEIRGQCLADFACSKARNPDRVSRNPELQIYYAVPILPFVIACEYDYVYGGLCGWGEGNLWLWKPQSPKAFCQYAYWVH